MPNGIHTHVSHGGRIVIPSELRKQFGLEEGTEVILTADEYGVRISTSDMALRQLQKIGEERIPKHKKGKIVDEFLAERRAEAERDL